MKVLTSKKKNSTEKITNAFIGSLLIILPLSTLLRDYSVIARSKFITLCALVGAFAILGILSLARNNESKRKLLPDSSDIALICYLFFSLLSTILSRNSKDAILGASRYEGFIAIVLYVSIFFAVKYYGVPKRWMVYALGTSSVGFSLIALLQLNGKNPFGLFPNGLNYYDAGAAYEGAYIGTIGNADVAGAFVCLAIPCILLYILLEKKDYWRFFLLFPLLLLGIVWYRMDVTAAHLGVLAGILLAAPFMLKKKKQRILGASLLFALFVFCVTVAFFFDAGTGLLHEIHAILHGRIGDGFGSSRIWIWTEIWPIAKENLLFGVGPDTLLLHAVNNTVYNSSINANIVASIDVAHNEFYNILVQQGLLALVSYLAFLSVLAWKWVKNARASTVIAICGTSVICYYVQAMFGMSACTTTPILMVALAIVDNNMKNSNRI